MKEPFFGHSQGPDVTFPPISDIRECALVVATAVVKEALEHAFFMHFCLVLI